MKHLNLELNEKTYQHLKTKFKGDEKAMCDFAVNALTDKLVKNSSDKNTKGLEDYLKSGQSGSRSYGTKGQGW